MGTLDMKKPNYYDNIAQIYDQTRWLTESVAEDVADFILALVCATPEGSMSTLYASCGVGVSPAQISVSRQDAYPTRNYLNARLTCSPALFNCDRSGCNQSISIHNAKIQ